MNRGWTVIGVVIVGMSLCAGCASKGKVPATPQASLKSPTVVPAAEVEPAMVAPSGYPANAFIADPTGRVVTRVWPVSVASYPNGSTTASPVYYETADVAMKRPDWQIAIFQFGLFGWNTIKLPYAMIVTPPCKDVIYSGGAEQLAPVPGSDQDPVQPKLR